MTSTAICVLGLFAFLAFSHLVSEVGSVLRARAKPPACPCRELHTFVINTDGEVRPVTSASPEAAARKVH
ncbi:hypothetical protein ACLBX9_15920 [Methylobacterium sp. A49B]